MQEPLGAFCCHADVQRDGAPAGLLKGLTFAVKDLFDIEGHVTGCGNPTWLATHPPATATAPAVQALLDAGARLVGKTVTDELAFSLMGRNAHYGIPRNPLAPGRFPGGSSSGSASVVAAKAADTALGTDTGGSVRLPASFCGLLGFRPTHGRVSMAGVMPLAPSFDTVGWFARDIRVLWRVADVLLGESSTVARSRGILPTAARSRGILPTAARSRGILLVEDAFAVADPQVCAALGPAIDAVTSILGAPRNITLTRRGLEPWVEVFRVIQGREIWAQHGSWIHHARPDFGPDIAERFAWTATVSEAAALAAAEERRRIAGQLDALLDGNDLLCLPTAPGIAPHIHIAGPELEGFRQHALCLLSIASLGGLPQVTLPVAELDGCPVGLSLIARHGADAMLLEAARRVAETLL